MRSKTIVRFVILIQLFVLFQLRPVLADLRTASSYSFKDDELFSGLSNNLLVLITYDKVPEKVHRHAALEQYALLFQLWLVKGKHVDPFLNKEYAKMIMRYVRPYVNLDDPMDLLPFYDGNTLSNIGSTKANFAPLQDADKIFKNKQTYQGLAAEFSNWRNNLTQ